VDPRTKFWVVVLGGVLVAWVLGELLSLVLWTRMRDRAMLAARLAWLVAVIGAACGVNAILGLFDRTPVLIGEGAALLAIMLLFFATWRRRLA
jgi:hypothetical protein